MGSTPTVVIGVEHDYPNNTTFNGFCVSNATLKKLIHEQVHYDLRIGSWFRFPPFELEG